MGHARVELVVGKHPNAIQVPVDAVTRLEDTQYVYIIRDGKAHQVPVEVGLRTENRVEITKGLAGDETVVLSGKDLVSEGMPVETRAIPQS